MDDAAGGRAEFLVGLDVGHHVVAADLLVVGGAGEVDVVDGGASSAICPSVIGSPSSRWRLGEDDREPSPGGVFSLVGPDRAHFAREA